MTCENWPLLEDSCSPGYIQIYDIVFQLIQDGVLNGGDSLPGENQLAAYWNVSRSTVRAAIRKLEEDGYLYKMQGKRTTVAVKTSRFDNGLQWMFNPCIRNCVMPVTTVNVTVSQVPCGKYVSELVNQDASTVMVKLEAGYFSEDRKVASSFLLVHSSMLESWNIMLRDERALKELAVNKIYEYAIRSQSELTAMTLEEELEEIPGCKNAIVIEEVLIGTNGEPVAYCKHRMNANWYRFAVDRKAI